MEVSFKAKCGLQNVERRYGVQFKGLQAFLPINPKTTVEYCTILIALVLFNTLLNVGALLSSSSDQC